MKLFLHNWKNSAIKKNLDKIEQKICLFQKSYLFAKNLIETPPARLPCIFHAKVDSPAKNVEKPFTSLPTGKTKKKNGVCEAKLET
jgi:hypothetical protein